MVDLDRGEPQAFEALDRARLAHEPGERVAGGPVTEAAEVDTREDDLAVTLADPALDLASARRAALRLLVLTAHQRDHAERARERAAVLDLHERAHPVEPVLRLDARDRADVTGDERRGVLADATGRRRRSTRSPSRAPARFDAQPVA